MLKDSAKYTINRILDANINRAKEGLRVCEEITRFILEDANLTIALKKLRHGISDITKCHLLETSLFKERNAKADIGKNIHINELKRKGLPDIFFANLQRAKESVRVLEEFSKLKTAPMALKFKRIRYALYELEKRAAKKIK